MHDHCNYVVPEHEIACSVFWASLVQSTHCTSSFLIGPLILVSLLEKKIDEIAKLPVLVILLK